MAARGVVHLLRLPRLRRDADADAETCLDACEVVGDTPAVLTPDQGQKAYVNKTELMWLFPLKV